MNVRNTILSSLIALCAASMAQSAPQNFSAEIEAAKILQSANKQLIELDQRCQNSADCEVRTFDGLGCPSPAKFIATSKISKFYGEVLAQETIRRKVETNLNMRARYSCPAVEVPVPGVACVQRKCQLRK